MSSRLGGPGRQPVHTLTPLDMIYIQRLPSMTEASRRSRRRIFKGCSERDQRRLSAIGQRPIDGDQERLARSVDRSEQLVEDALFTDPRLARRAQWKRSDEGEHVCPGLLAMGDDQPFYKHTRAVVNTSTAAGEPVRIVVSTDDKHVPDDTAAAFIATARIVQQFVPLEIWWQGAWLSEDERLGIVNHVPLVQGDMDFSRLDFCIADPCRDAFSFLVMAAFAVNDLRKSWGNNGHRARQSYLEDEQGCRLNAKFVPHTGITPDGNSIALHAANWLGWEGHWSAACRTEEASKSASQDLPVSDSGISYPAITDEDRRRWAEQERLAAQRREKEAGNRMAEVH